MMSLFIDSTGIVKGIGGNLVKIWGHGKIHLYLLPCSGKYYQVADIENALYAPSSTFNIITTQIIITNLKTKYNLYVDHAKTMTLNTSPASKRSINNYLTAISPYQLGVMVYSIYELHQDTTNSSQET